MKKILLLSVFAALTFTGCKKKENTVSTLVTVSYPTVTITSPQFYSFPVGGGPLPTSAPNAVNSILATAYDSFYHENLTAVVDVSTLSDLIPGLYVATVSARNSYGFVGYAYVYVAITDVSDTMDISGIYWRVLPGDTSSLNPAIVSKVARGLYRTSNVGGVDTGTQKTTIVPAYFAVINNSTAIDFGTQPTSAGVLTASSESLTFGIGDTALTYAINLNGFGSQVRTFIKQ